MFRVLLIDDEPHHIEYLTRMVEAAAMPFTICGTAFDGQSALEQYCKLHPDLVISDIKMPMKNGLSLTKEMKEINRETPVILISAYQDFDYARQGLQLGILDYLLKPVGDEELKKALHKAEERLTESRSNMLRRSLFPVPATEQDSIPEMENTLRSLSPYRLGLYLSQPGGDALERLWYRSGRKPPQQILELETQADGSRLFLFTESDSGGTITFEDAGLKKGQLVLSDINPPLQPWEDLGGRMSERLWERGIWGDSSIISLNQDCTAGDDSNPFLPYEWELKSALAADLEEALLPLLLRILQETYSKKIPLGQLKEAITLLDRILIREFAIKKNIPQSQIRRILEKLNLDLAKLNFEPEKIAVSLVNALAAAVPEEVSRSYSIQKVKDYMDRNYAQNIDTTSLADMTGVSAKTLKHLFLREFGVSPSKYLIEIRIDVAKKLLTTRPDLQIKEIARETGYEDPLYFSRIFHRKVGKNPTQYRVENQSSTTTI